MKTFKVRSGCVFYICMYACLHNFSNNHTHTHTHTHTHIHIYTYNVRQENRYEQGGKRIRPGKPRVDQLKIKMPEATRPGMFEYSPDKGEFFSIAQIFIVLIMQAQLIF